MSLQNLFDTHAHLDDERFNDDRGYVLKRMPFAGVTYCLCVGAGRESSEAAAALAQIGSPSLNLYAAVGVHPQSAETFSQDDKDWLQELAARPEVVAIGEIGLDYHYEEPPRETQRIAYTSQMAWAAEWNKPVILHIRDSHDDTLESLRAMNGTMPPEIVLHCYSGDCDQAKQYLDLGCMISFAGNVTFKNAHNLHDAARYVPLDRLLIETDCPYLAPEPLRGRRNEPAFISHTAARIAQLRGITPEELAKAATANAIKVFRIEKIAGRNSLTEHNKLAGLTKIDEG
ncbi:hydrolase TatD [Clostridia bacterium]|nr:hydrolase TatD [Clostridia bacterium]